MVTIQDIAAICGVSKSTVSKALNGHKDVHPATRARILETAQMLGYQSAATTREASAGRSHLLGIILTQEPASDAADDHVPAILQSFRCHAAEAGYDLILFASGEAKGVRLSLQAHVRQRRTDGVCVLDAGRWNGAPEGLSFMNSSLHPQQSADPGGLLDRRQKGDTEEGDSGECRDPQLQELSAEEDIPFVSVGCRIGARAAVLPDHAGNQRILEEYIRGCGHQRIAEIHAAAELSSEQPVDPAEQTKGLLAAPDPPTCIRYPDDASAMAGIQVIRSLGRQVPADVSVAGYGGIDLLRRLPLHPELTTVRLDVQTLGVRAAELLISQIEHPAIPVPSTTLVPGILHRGETVRRL